MAPLPSGLDPSRQAVERLQVLATLHYIVAGLVLAFALLPLGFVALGGVVLLAPESLASGDSELPPGAVGLLFLVLGVGLFLYGLVLAIALVMSASGLRRRKHYWLTVVVACGVLTFTPLGTLLGVATLVVLLQDSVRDLYGVSFS